MFASNIGRGGGRGGPEAGGVPPLLLRCTAVLIRHWGARHRASQPEGEAGGGPGGGGLQRLRFGAVLCRAPPPPEAQQSPVPRTVRLHASRIFLPETLLSCYGPMPFPRVCCVPCPVPRARGGGGGVRARPPKTYANYGNQRTNTQFAHFATPKLIAAVVLHPNGEARGAV